MNIWKVILRNYVINDGIMSYPDPQQRTWIVVTFGGYSNAELINQWNYAVHEICIKIGGQPQSTTFDAERLELDANGIIEM